MDPQRFVRYLHIFGRLSVIWPPDLKATNRELLFNDNAWTLLVMINCTAIGSMIKMAIEVADDPVALSKFVSEISIIADYTLNLILITMEWPRFQILTREVIDFVKNADGDESIVFRKYIKRYMIWYIAIAGFYMGAIVAFGSTPFTQAQPFPIDSWYPFNADDWLNRIFIYIIQYTAILQVVWIVSGDFMIVLLIWYASAQLELLGLAMSAVNSIAELRKCVDRHEEIMRFVKETNRAVQLIYLKTLCVAFLIILFGGIQLVKKETLTTISQFIVIICSTSLRIFGWTWAGDDLTEMAEKLSWSIYQSPAVVGSLRLRKCVIIVMQRTQRSSIINVWGTSLRLSLGFFAVYSIRVMSFFMTLRAVLDRWL